MSVTNPRAPAVSTDVATTADVAGRPMMSLDRLEMRYDPFPIGHCDGILDADFHRRLLDSWPPSDLFLYKPALGHKYSLSEVNNPENYAAFVRGSRDWSMLHRLIKSPAFIDYVLESLLNHNIDLGFSAENLSARFEFSMLGGRGGSIKPHTDAPNKIVTLVIYMVREGEWDASYGGGTSILRPKDIRRSFNHMNAQLDFSDVECLHTFPCSGNGCVLFIKTFNSYHCVFPNNGPEHFIRKSLTINIEDPNDSRLRGSHKGRSTFRM